MRISTYVLILLSLALSACGGKQVSSMQNASIRTIPKLRVGVVELSSHDFNIPFFYECMKNLPSNTLVLDGQTRQELESSNWYSDNLIASLKTQDFAAYNNIKNFSVLLLIFKNKEQKSFVRMINFLSKQVRTVALTEDQFSCENVLSNARVLVVESIPPFADVYIDNRKIGEAPVWTSLNDGNYEVQCKLPEDVFPKKTLKVPGPIQYLCKRDNQSVRSIENDSDNNATFSEKSQSVFLYAFLGLVSVGGAVLPFLLF